MNGFIKKHYLIFFIALLVGVVVFLPTLRSVQKTSNFQGIYPTFSDDELYYLAITKEAYEGKINSGNTFLKEHKEDLAMQPLFFEILPAGEAKLLHISVPQVFILNDFLLPFFGVIVLYFVFFFITESTHVSNLFSSAYYLFFLASMGRPISPQFGIVFFYLGIVFVWEIVSKKHKLKNFIFLNIILAFIFSALVYIYPFYWTSVILLYLLTSIGVAITDREFWYWVKGYLFFGITSIVLLVPYALNTLKLSHSSSFLESSIRNGLVFSHSPGAFVSVAFLFFCLPIIYFSSAYFKERKEVFFCYSFVVCGLLLNWQNIISGKILQFSSHYYMVTIFFVFLSLSLVIKNIRQRREETFTPTYKKYIALVLSGVLIFLILYKQQNDIITPFKNIIYPKDISKLQEASPALAWLDHNTPPDSVVYALGGEYEMLVPVYTKNNVYSNWYAGMSLVSDDEMENRWVVENFWNNVDSSLIEDSHRSIWINKFQDTYAHKEVVRKIVEMLTGKKYPANILVPKQAIDVVLDKYKKFKSEGFERSLKTYQVDYILLDLMDPKYRSLETKLSSYPFLVLQTKTDTFEIFKVN